MNIEINHLEITTRKSCRICDSTLLKPLYSIGEQYINNFIRKDEIKKCIKAPLEMVICDNCTLLQLKHTAPQELLYARYYWYKSGVTVTMNKALRDITSKVEIMFDLKEGDVVLDIGSNDGTLLRSYSVPGLITIGVEPADNLLEEGKQGLTYHIHDFWNHDVYEKTLQKKANLFI